jgi:protocatechuate 3,4-dioxygenase beta subunit
MRGLRVSPVIAIVIAATLSLTGATTAQQADAGSIEGFVRRSDTLGPIADVPVTLMGPFEGKASQVTTQTDSNGRFIFQDVTPGRYLLKSVDRPGFFRQRGDSQTLTLAARQKTIDVELLLNPGATLGGRVLDSSDNPIRNVSVELVQREGRSIGLASVGSIYSFPIASTNANGEYRLTTPPGDYYLRAGFRETLAEESYRTTYYPDALQPLNARRIVAMAGSEETRLDIRPQKSATWTISGRIVRTEPIIGEWPTQLFYLYSDNPTAPLEGKTVPATVDPESGRFEIHNVLPGSYELVVADENLGPERQAGRAFAVVGNEDRPGVSLVLRPLMELKGRIIGLEHATLPRSLTLFPIAERAAYSISSGRTAGVDEDWNFTLKDLMDGGSFRLELAGLPANYCIRDIRQGTRSVLDNGVVSASSPAERIELEVSGNCGAIEGAVSNIPRGAQNVGVVLVPDSHRANVELYKYASVDAQGRFTMTGIAPGSYKVFSWETYQPQLREDPDFITSYEDRGTHVVVTESTQVPDVHVTLIRRGL